MNLAGFRTVGVDPTLSFQMSVEVERKFVCNADTPKTLEEIGGMCLIYLAHYHTWIHFEFN